MKKWEEYKQLTTQYLNRHAGSNQSTEQLRSFPEDAFFVSEHLHEVDKSVGSIGGVFVMQNRDDKI